jgi:hypothetical protein
MKRSKGRLGKEEYMMMNRSRESNGRAREDDHDRACTTFLKI